MVEGDIRQPQSRRLRSLLLWGLAVLAMVELIWVVGANWALSSGFVQSRVNRRPEKLVVDWERARTVIPGWVSVEGVTVRGQARKQQWYVEVDEARLHVSLVALVRKTFKTYSLKVTGVEFRLRRRLDSSEPQPLAEFWPTIPELANDAPAPTPGKPAKGRRPWVLDLEDIRVDGIRQLWVLPYRLVAKGTIDADFRMVVRGPLVVERAVGALREVEIFARGSRVAEEMSLDLEASLGPWVPAEVKGPAAMGSLSGSVALEGRSTTSGFLNQVLSSFGPIAVGDTGGAIKGTLLIGDGKLLEGTHVELTPKDGWLDVLDWRAVGAIDAAFDVRGVEGASPALVTLSLTGVDVFSKEVELPLLEGALVEVAAIGGELDLTQGVPGLIAAATSVDIDLTGATIADVTRIAIPPIPDFSIDSGRVEAEGHAKIGRTGAEARFEAFGEGIGASYGEASLTGDLSIALEMATPDLASREFTLSDSSVKIDDVTIGTGENAQTGWYAHLDVREGALSLAKPKEMSGAFDLRMQDSRPIIALLQQRRPAIGRLRRILDFSDLTGEATISMAAAGVVLEEIDVKGKGLHVMTRLHIVDSKASGIFYSRFHGIPLGVDLRGEKADLVFRRPKVWYEAQLAAERSRP